MAKKLVYKEVEYPLQFNFLVFKNWEKETGSKISELGALAADTGAVGAVDVLTLLFFAVQDACEEQGIDFPFTLKQFIRGIDIAKLEDMTKLIDLSDGGEVENKGQSKRTAKK